ncbi:hypothetical protein, partial [Streptomyces clavifer]|uniref:hypothetical protein n=1 Tax=Streptomyces clavifer TaxID=68188 RepID=UPI002380DDBD
MGSTLLRAPKLQTFETSKSQQNQEGLNISAGSNFPNLQKLSGMLSHHAKSIQFTKIACMGNKRKKKEGNFLKKKRK